MEFKKSINYYREQYRKLTKSYNQGKLSLEGYKARKKQIKTLINTLEQELIIQAEGIKTKKIFNIFVYGKNESELLENINLLENKLINGNFICEQLNNYEMVQILHAIWNPYAPLITKEQFQTNKNNLSEILSFKKFELHKTYFTADNLKYAISGIYDSIIS